MEAIFWRKIFLENSFPCLVLSKSFEVLDTNEIARQSIELLGEKQFIADLFSAIDILVLEEFLSSEKKSPYYFSILWNENELIGQLVWFENKILLLATPNLEDSRKRNTKQTNDLLEDILHSIRNPLAVIQGRIDLMNLITKDSNMQRYLGNIAEQCQRIISVLDVAQTISIRPFRATEFRIQSVVQDSLSALELDIACPTELDVSIQNDQERIKIILFSILSLIKRFGVLKRIQFSRQQATYDLSFVVEMSKEGLNLLYDIKTGTIRQKQKGSDYQLYGLQIALESCNVGLDFEYNKIMLRFAHEEPHDQGKIAKSTILLVDDDQMLRETLVGLLSFDGYHIVTSNSAEEALQQLEREIDIILMDVKLPGMSGLDFLDHIEQTHPDLIARTILISGMSVENTKAVPFLQKPFSRALLTKTINDILEHLESSN